MNKGLESRQKPSNPSKNNNFVGRVKGLKVFIGNFTYECNFMILEDTTSIIDHHLGEVVFGKPFARNTGLVYDQEEGTVTFEKDDEKITFKMPHKIEASNRIDFKDINTDSIPPFVLGSNDDRGKTYYSDSLTLGPEYREDESISKEIEQKPKKFEREPRDTKEKSRRNCDFEYFAFGGHLEELHVTWAHLEKKRTRLRTYANISQDNVLSGWRRRHRYNVTPSQRRPRRRHKIGDWDTRIKSRKYTSDKSFTLGYTEVIDNVNILQSCNGLLLCTDYAHDDSKFIGCAGLRLTFDPTKSPDYKWCLLEAALVRLLYKFTLQRQFTIYKMAKGCSVWSIKYIVDADDFMTPLPEGWSIRYIVWSLVVGEREEGSFLVMNLSVNVVQYNLISKTVREIYILGSR
ncbi:protein kinase-like domain, concanavalin A-like lectin/glucanase domain protein [Tanacetum coccineum]